MHTNINKHVFIVGSGLFGSVIAERMATVLNIKSTVIERRNHIGGNCFSSVDKETGVIYHVYGTHIFHTSNKFVWEYVNQFADFNGYHHQVLTTYKNKVYQLPINLETINSFYNQNLKPFEVKEFLKKEIKKEKIKKPCNFEEQAISMIGRPLYEAFIKGYTIKQWQKDPKDLPASIIQRLPFRTNYDENYFHDRWQGVPENGYTPIFKKMLDHKNINLMLETDYFSIREEIPKDAVVIYSGPIDRFFDFKFGKLQWRTLDFEHEIVNVDDFQGISVMNYAEEHVPFTRIHEPKHLHPERKTNQSNTLIIKEFSRMDDGSQPYYPINDIQNKSLLAKYKEEATRLPNVFFSGRLGEYKYLDMHQTVENALQLFEHSIKPLFSS